MSCSEVKRYGFDFDGNTGIKGYTQYLLSENNMCLYFEFKYDATTPNNAYIYDSMVNGSNSGRLTITTTNDNVLVFTYYVNNIIVFNYATPNGFLVDGNTYKVLLNGSKYNGILGYKWNIYIDNNIQYTESIDDMSIVGFQIMSSYNIIFTRHIGSYYNGTSATKHVIANFTFWDSTKSSSEINDLFNDFSEVGYVFYESFDQEVNGAVSGVEQYAEIDTETVCDGAELFERKETITFDSVSEYDWTIADWVYGGECEITVNASGNKTIETAIFDPNPDINRYFVIDKQITTNQIITVQLPDNEARRMLIRVRTSEVQPIFFTSISYKFSLSAPITVNAEGISVGLNTYDLGVNYTNNQTISDSVTARVPKESKNLFMTICEKELYFQNNKRFMLNRAKPFIFDINNYTFDLQLTRLL